MASTIDAGVRRSGDELLTVPRRIVVPISGHWDTQRALPAATWMAGRAKAPMLLVSVVIDAAFVGDRHAELEAIAEDLRAQGLEVVTLVRRTDEIAAALVEETHRQPGSVICMPSHGPGRFLELAIGTVTQDVVDHATDPVVLVGPRVEAVAPPNRFVAAADDTAPSQRAVALAGRWARAFGVGLELVEVVDPRIESRLGHGDVLESTTLRGYAADLRTAGVVASWEVLHGRDRSDAIVRHLEDRPGAWAVLGTHARHGIPRLAQGSIAMQVVHHSPVPVVVVR